ncbi:MAG: hypothetical protein HQK53_03570 [Oligoflexia bacterium]|nr:hypothetical protein [Oligoflexia bacterium]
MGQAILVSDNEVINDIYSVNLYAYVATNITVKKNLIDTINLLEQNPNVDLIICFAKINKEAIAKNLQSYLKKRKLRIPLIVLGDLSEQNKENKQNASVEDIIMLPSIYNIRDLVRSVAKILEISSQYMVSLPMPDFFPIPIKLFSHFKNSDSDIFYRVVKGNFENEYIRIIEKNSTLGEKINNYSAEGVTHLYIPSAERLKFINQISGIIVSQLENGDLSNSDRMELTEQGADLVYNQIFENKSASEEVVKISKVCASSINKIIKDTPQFSSILSTLLHNKTKYVYLHSILASYIASELIKKMPWGTDEHAEKISFVLFFHDIYLSPIFDKHPEIMTEEELYFNPTLSGDEKEIVLNHARMAAELVSSFKQIPIGSDIIIKQHHGTTSGVGFATEYKDDISPLAKVIVIAEDYTINILRSRLIEKTPFDKEAVLSGIAEKFHRHSYKKMVEMLVKIAT